jgi:cytochrome b
MKTHVIEPKLTQLSTFAIMVHLGLVLFGITALLSGGLADDYKKVEHARYTLHSWIGMGCAFFVFLRVVLGIGGPRHLRFCQWVPYTRERLRKVGEDIMGLFRFQLPERQTHVGVAGLVQAFGIMTFFVTAASGVLLFFILEPGHKAEGLAHSLKELHEGSLFFVLLFLALHVGAVVAHMLRGRHLWRPMVFLKEPQDLTVPEESSVTANRANEKVG